MKTAETPPTKRERGPQPNGHTTLFALLQANGKNIPLNLLLYTARAFRRALRQRDMQRNPRFSLVGCASGMDVNISVDMNVDIGVNINASPSSSPWRAGCPARASCGACPGRTRRSPSFHHHGKIPSRVRVGNRVRGRGSKEEGVASGGFAAVSGQVRCRATISAAVTLSVAVRCPGRSRVSDRVHLRSM